MILRALHVQLDNVRVWYKVTWARGRILATEGNGWEAFETAAHFEDPALFYDTAPQPPVQEEIIGRVAGAEVVRFTFPTRHPLKFAESNLAVGRLYRRPGALRAPVVLVSHGWAHRSLRPVEHLYVRPFLRAGYAVAFVMHPLHLDRTPAGAYSGELLVSGDVVLTVEAFRQAAADMLAAAAWLRAAGARDIGLFGYSLGGYVAGIMAAVRGDWAFTVIGGAGHSLTSPILDTPLGRNVREDLRACGMLDRRRLARAWRIISPAAFAPKVPRERILLLAGRYDRIMLPSSVRRLWSAWGRPRLEWLDRGHYTLLATNGGLLARAVPFMRDLAPPPATRAPAP